jgi:dihydrofolate synthase/folylpolyglutamate synthase
VEPTERIRIAGIPVSREQFAEAFDRVHHANMQLQAGGVLEHHTTYFETVTAMGFLLFRDLGVEQAVVEVGLGGRLDATNVVQPELTVITPIDFDHERFLGNSLEAIAGEKAGILKPGCPAVFARQRPEAQMVLDRCALELGVRTVRTSEYAVRDLSLEAHASTFAVERSRVLNVRCPLAGVHQVENAVTAVAALEDLGITSRDIEQGVAVAVWPGRMQRIGTAPEIILDGAHNPAGARALAEHIRRFYAGRNVWLVYGAMRDKSVQEITEILFPLAQEVLLTTLDSARAVRPEVLKAESEHTRMRIAGSVAEALAAARTAAPEDVVFVTGSLHLVGEVLALLQ